MTIGYRISHFIGNVLLRLLFQFKVYESGNIPESGGVLIFANHMSFLDPVVIGASVKRQLNFIAREELFHIPIFSWIIRRYGAFPIKRSKIDRGAIEYSLKLLREGRILLWFPEGTRSINGRLGNALPGTGVIAIKAYKLEAKVIPARIFGTEVALPRGRIFIKPAKIRVRFGKSIEFDKFFGDIPKKEIYRKAANMIMEHIKSLAV
ncbi:MAG: lysophospholipid acyltransferase family protein [bacterium]|nr:lysophospholipid acyltransferase family protein [bacterium]